MASPEPVGVRVELMALPDDDLGPLVVGSRGTVIGGITGQVLVKWDCGWSSGLTIGRGLWRRVGPEIVR